MSMIHLLYKLLESSNTKQQQMTMGGRSSKKPKDERSPQMTKDGAGQPSQSPTPMNGQQYQMARPMGGPQYQMTRPMGGPQYQTAMPMTMPPVNSVPLPESIPGVPTGLEYLHFLDTVFVRQQIEALEIISGQHMPNKYDLFNLHGELIFRAIEVTDPLTTVYQRSNRNFSIIILDSWGRQVMSLSRPWSFILAQQPLTVCAPPGNIVGIVEPQNTWIHWYQGFFVRDAIGQLALKIQGMGGMCFTWGSIDFKILTLGGAQVGSITKQYAGIIQEMHTAADNFVITFPKDLSVGIKAALVGACLLLDFMYFENVQGKRHRGYGYHRGYHRRSTF